MQNRVLNNNLTVAGILLFLLISGTAFGRSVFLNGTDISSARQQSMKNVTVRIDGSGNVFIEAPHYQVNEENTYYPLSPSARPDLKMPNKKGEVASELSKTSDGIKVEPVKTQPVGNGQPPQADAKPTVSGATPPAAGDKPNTQQ